MADDYTMEVAFPKVDPEIEPCGSLLLLQVRAPKRKIGSIILTDNTVDTIKDNTQVAKLIAKGPMAFRNRQTLEVWKEGEWAQIGDFIRIKRYAAENFKVETEDGPIEFVLVNDLDVLGRYTGDPLKVPTKHI